MPRRTFTIEIPVTEEQIRQGLPYDSRSCPIALSLKQRFPGHDCRVFDDDGFLSIEPEEDGGAGQSEFAGRYEVDDSVLSWVRRYDDERDTGPATLQLLKTRNREKGNACELLYYHDDPRLSEL